MTTREQHARVNVLRVVHAQTLSGAWTQSDKRLAMKTAGQALQPRHGRQAFNPGGAPVVGGVLRLGLTRRTAGSITLLTSRVLVGIGVATTAAFDAVELAGRDQIVAMVAASQVAGDLVVSDHWDCALHSSHRL
ncbi:hypothetical protein D3C76_1325370 [compost metagenome]